MKLIRKNKIIVGAVSGAVAVAVIVTVILLASKMSHPVTPDSEAEKPSSDVVVNLPTDRPAGDGSSDTTDKEKDEGLVIDVSGEPENPTGNSGNGNDGNPVQPPERPIEQKEPEQPSSNNNGSGIQIGEGDKPVEQYTCGSPNHHCKNAEAHAYIQNLELEGCSFCGSHNCPSFYDVNEWGFTRYNQARCPNYSEKNDPAKYCQRCGRALWSQGNPTGCFSYLQDTNCECGEHVKGNTCHHH